MKNPESLADRIAFIHNSQLLILNSYNFLTSITTYFSDDAHHLLHERVRG